MTTDARAGEGAVANRANIIDAEGEVGKGTQEVVQPLPHPRPAVIVARDGSEQGLDLATWVVERHKRVEVSTNDGIEGPASQFDVLLRHRRPVSAAQA